MREDTTLAARYAALMFGLAAEFGYDRAGYTDAKTEFILRATPVLKKPPTPDESHQLIDDWIADARPVVNPILQELDKQIVSQLKEPRYAIKWSKAYYGSPERGWCIEVAPYDISANVVFLNGGRLDPPPALGMKRVM